MGRVRNLVWFLLFFSSLSLATTVSNFIRIQSESAAEVIRHRMGDPRLRPIPREVYQKSLCFLVLKAIKLGVGVGFLGSSGLASCRLAEGFSAPLFFKVTAVGAGPFVGVKEVESILLFMDESVVSFLTRPRFVLGKDLQVTLGSFDAGGNSVIEKGLLAYNYLAGFFMGFSLDGLAFSYDEELNFYAYGGGKEPEQILALSSSQAPREALTFMEALEYFFLKE